MKIYFTLYLIPVVVLALLVFWLALRKEKSIAWCSYCCSAWPCLRC